MEIVHLYTAKRGVRFYSEVYRLLNEEFNSDEYTLVVNRNSFLRKLEVNSQEYDVILITAHGAEDSIIIPRRQYDILNHNTEYQRYITMDDVDKFKKDFVFAVACSTAMEFGPKAVEKGAISYLGYEVIIEQLFKVSEVNMSKRVRETYETIVKHIFVEELAKAFTKFIKEFQTVKMLKQNFSFFVEKRLIELFKMNAQEVYSTYKLGINEELWKKNKPNLQIMQLEVLDNINNHLIILGDSNYISLIGIKQTGVVNENIRNRITNPKFQDDEYKNLFQEKINIYLSNFE